MAHPTITQKLQARIADCGGGEEIPQWCIATGKCSCHLATILLDHLKGESDEVQMLAEAAYDLGLSLGKD